MSETSLVDFLFLPYASMKSSAVSNFVLLPKIALFMLEKSYGERVQKHNLRLRATIRERLFVAKSNSLSWVRYMPEC